MYKMSNWSTLWFISQVLANKMMLMSVSGCRTLVRVFTRERADLPVKRRTAGRQGSCGTDQTHPRLLEELQTLSWQRPPLPDRAVKQTPAKELHSSTSQTTLRVHTWLLSPRSNVFTVSYSADNEIHSLKRSTDLDKCIDIFKTRTKLRFLLCFFRWWRTIALFNSSSTTRGGSHIENMKSRRLQPRENTSSSVPTCVSTPANIATWRTVVLLLATSSSQTLGHNERIFFLKGPSKGSIQFL